MQPGRVEDPVELQRRLRQIAHVHHAGLVLGPFRLQRLPQLVDLGVLVVQAVPQAFIALLHLLELLVRLLQHPAQPLRFLRLVQQKLQQLPPAQLLQFLIRHGVFSFTR